MNHTLQQLGLVPFFSQQLSLEDVESRILGRVIEVQRTLVVVACADRECSVPTAPYEKNANASERPTVGDWLLLDDSYSRIEKLLERKTVFARVAAGTRTDIQLIAANIDILFIVSSCNEEFNESRLERYLALAAEAGVTPVLVLTKTDLADDPYEYADRARAVQRDVAVELVSSQDPGSVENIAGWVSEGITVALVGSSGVGKSTLLNALAGQPITATADIREADQKGRHTTTYRSLYRLPAGGLMIDVPGMRELKVAEIEGALGAVFDDIEVFAAQCQFSDCAHQAEPECAVRQAVEAGELSERRLQSYLKLQRESAHNNASLAQQRAQGRDLAKLIKQAKNVKKGRG